LNKFYHGSLASSTFLCIEQIYEVSNRKGDSVNHSEFIMSFVSNFVSIYNSKCLIWPRHKLSLSFSTMKLCATDKDVKYVIWTQLQVN